MAALVDRDYCLKHPWEIIQAYGFWIFLGMMLNPQKGLLERVVEYYAAHAFPLPGHVGRAYRLSALIEYRVAAIYGRLADRFTDRPPVGQLFDDLCREEQEHGRLMELCRYTVSLHPRLRYTPQLHDPEIRPVLSRLRELQHSTQTLSLEAALALAEELEAGEINTIFGRLLRQVENEDVQLFAAQLHAVEDHRVSVPRRIAALRNELGLD